MSDVNQLVISGKVLGQPELVDYSDGKITKFIVSNIILQPNGTRRVNLVNVSVFKDIISYIKEGVYVLVSGYLAIDVKMYENNGRQVARTFCNMVADKWLLMNNVEPSCVGEDITLEEEKRQRKRLKGRHIDMVARYVYKKEGEVEEHQTVLD